MRGNKFILAVVLMALIAGCQTYSETEYFETLHPETGEQLIKKHVERDGVAPWSDNKTFEVHGSAVGK